MQILVINLASEEARWAHAARQFALAGVQPERFEAVRGRDLEPERVAALYSPALNARLYHKPLCAGEIGCYASHLAAWRRLLESRERHLAVFEDDVTIDGDLPTVLDAIERLPHDWDMVKLIGRSRERVRQRLDALGHRRLVSYARVPGLTSAYVVSRRGAKKLLASRVPFGRPIDIDLRHWWECDVRILGVQPYPVLAAASSLLTTIEGRRSRADAASRWRKFVLQARYLALNCRATWVAPAPGASPRARALASPPAP